MDAVLVSEIDALALIELVRVRELLSEAEVVKETVSLRLCVLVMLLVVVSDEVNDRVLLAVLEGDHVPDEDTLVVRDADAVVLLL